MKISWKSKNIKWKSINHDKLVKNSHTWKWRLRNVNFDNDEASAMDDDADSGEWDHPMSITRQPCNSFPFIKNPDLKNIVNFRLISIWNWKRVKYLSIQGRKQQGEGKWDLDLCCSNIKILSCVVDLTIVELWRSSSLEVFSQRRSRFQR